MSGRVDPPGQSADDGQPPHRQVEGEAIGHPPTIRRGVSGSDNGDRPPVPIFPGAAHVEHGRGLGNLPKGGGVLCVPERDEPEAPRRHPLSLPSDRLLRGKRADGLRRDGTDPADTFKRLERSLQDASHASEALQEQRKGGRSYMGHHVECQPCLPLLHAPLARDPRSMIAAVYKVRIIPGEEGQSRGATASRPLSAVSSQQQKT
jgi:hypothetical protein